MNWFTRILPPKIKQINSPSQRNLPDGVWSKCDGCESIIFGREFLANQLVCPNCGHHHRMSARSRIMNILDSQVEIREIGAEIEPNDPLRFRDSKRYIDRFKQAQTQTNEKDCLIVLTGQVEQIAIVIAGFDFEFMGGSMGSVVGERFVQGVNYAIEHHYPFMCITASGGARMQEGLFSLMQMAKTNAAIGRLNQAGLPFVTLLTDPTMGGVSASFAFIADIVMAEPGALIGFAGPRVIEQTVRERLPSGFQRAEFLQQKGAIDLLVDRRHLRATLTAILSVLLKCPNPSTEKPQIIARQLYE